MKIVSNIMHPTPNAGNAGLEAAVKAASYWNSKCSVKQSLYRVISGMPLGTMANSMRAENWGELMQLYQCTRMRRMFPSKLSLGNILLHRPSPRWRM